MACKPRAADAARRRLREVTIKAQSIKTVKSFTSPRKVSAWRDNSPAADSTRLAEWPASSAAACSTLRAISWDAASCSSTVGAIKRKSC